MSVDPEEMQQSPAHPAGHFARVRLFVHEHPNLVAIGIAAVGLGITFLIWRSGGGGIKTTPQTSNSTTAGDTSGGVGTSSSAPTSADPTTTGLLGGIQDTLRNIQTTLATLSLGNMGNDNGHGSTSSNDQNTATPTYPVGGGINARGVWGGSTGIGAPSPSPSSNAPFGPYPPYPPYRQPVLQPGGTTGVRALQITPSSPMRVPDLPRYIAGSGGAGLGRRFN